MDQLTAKMSVDQDNPTVYFQLTPAVCMLRAKRIYLMSSVQETQLYFPPTKRA